MTDDKYLYHATNVGGNTWMVRRYPLDQFEKEALIQSESTDPDSVIQEAIDRRSWA